MGLDWANLECEPWAVKSNTVIFPLHQQIKLLFLFFKEMVFQAFCLLIYFYFLLTRWALKDFSQGALVITCAFQLLPSFQCDEVVFQMWPMTIKPQNTEKVKKEE